MLKHGRCNSTRRSLHIVVVVAILHGIACDARVATLVSPSEAKPDRQPASAGAEQVARFCGDCHATPAPDTFPRQAWPREVKRGFDFYFESFRSDLTPPAEEEVIAYYQGLAPLELQVTAPPRDPDASRARSLFSQQTTPSPVVEPPAVSSISWVQLPGDDQNSLVFCDMRSGEISRVLFPGSQLEVELLATLTNPARLTTCDLNGDGSEEIVVAELGSFTSEDHHRGALVWLRRDQTGDQTTAWRQRLLVSGLGRVADVRPADFDQDGDTDLVVAEFGHLWTGRILLYENLGGEEGIPRLREHVIDDRHGGIHVPVGDLDGDGLQDFVALISQEHEVIEAYLGDGQGGFRRERVFTAGDPSYGSSGIQLVDLDQDGDLDVLYSNGDTFGSDHLKPSHGVTWLENRGAFPFAVHRLGDMVGVQRAVAADLDGDGDLDIVAVGFMPSNLVTDSSVSDRDSVIWLEQIEAGEFRRHSLETGTFQHAALEIGDFDNDGDADLAVGNFQDIVSAWQPWLTIWWNRRKDAAVAGSTVAE